MSDVTTVLKSSFVFGMLDDAAIETIGALFERWETHPGDTLTAAGEPAQYFFLLGAGRVMLGMDDGRAVVLDTPGDFIGLELMSYKGVCKSMLSVLEKGSVFVVDREAFLAVIRENTESASQIMAHWQAFLETVAPFARNSEDICLPEHF